MNLLIKHQQQSQQAMEKFQYRLATVLMSSILHLVSTEPGRSASDAGDLKAEFTTPPTEARPRFYWFWLGSAMTKEGIQADLQAMNGPTAISQCR